MEIPDIRRIDTVDEWMALSLDLKEDEYTVWQMQYDYYDPEGFHVWFWASKRPEIEVITHNEAVQKAIVKY